MIASKNVWVRRLNLHRVIFIIISYYIRNRISTLYSIHCPGSRNYFLYLFSSRVSGIRKFNYIATGCISFSSYIQAFSSVKLWWFFFIICIKTSQVKNGVWAFCYKPFSHLRCKSMPLWAIHLQQIGYGTSEIWFKFKSLMCKNDMYVNNATASDYE